MSTDQTTLQTVAQPIVLQTIQPAPLAIGHFNPNQEQIDLLKRTICANSSDDEFELFLMVCKRTGLDPFARQIHAVKRWDNAKGCNVMAVQTGIDGFRLIAERTRKYQGQTPPQWCGKDGIWKDVWTNDEVPFAARVGIWKENFREPAWGVAHFDEYAQTKKGGDLNHMWSQMPRNQIAKCAEALGLRKAFPQELGGIYTDDEMGIEGEGRGRPMVGSTPTGQLPAPTPWEPDPEVTEENWRAIVNTGATTDARRKPIGELPRPYVEWFLSHGEANAEKGMVQYWKAHPNKFGPEERKVWTAMTLALAFHTERKAKEAEAAEHNQEQPETPPKKHATKDAAKMLLKMINSKSVNLDEFTKAAIDLAILPDSFDGEFTPEQATELLEKFSEIVDQMSGGHP